MPPEEEALVLEGLADYRAGRMFSEEEVRAAIREARIKLSHVQPYGGRKLESMTEEELPEEIYNLTQEEEILVAAAEEQVRLGLVMTTEEVQQNLREIRAEWIKKNPRSAQSDTRC